MQDEFTQSPKRSLSVKKRLVLLLTVMTLPFIAFSVFKAFDINNRLEQDAHNTGLALARNIAQDIDDYILATGELLVPIASNDALRTQNYQEATEFLREVWPNYPFYTNIIFVDTNGDIKASSRPVDDGGSATANVSDSAYYQRSMQTNGLAVGDFMYCKLTKNPVIHITYPVFDDNSNRVGLVAAVFDLTKVQNKLIHSSVPRHTLAAIIDSRGVMIARNQEPEKWVGKDYSERMGFKDMVGKKEGAGKTVNPDGTTRIYAFARASEVPWYVRVGVDADHIQTQVRQELFHHFAVFLPLLLVALFGWVWIGRDVDRLHKTTEYLTLIDPLSELWNYRKLEQDLNTGLSRARRFREQLSFLMIDVDHFKDYNDNNGHQMGDETLRLVAEIIKEAVRDIDMCYRYGGEEMCVILPSTDREEAVAVAERIRAEVEKARFPGEERQPRGRLTVSVGVSTYPQDAISKDGLIKSADMALHKAKENGRNRVEAYEGDYPDEDDEPSCRAECV